MMVARRWRPDSGRCALAWGVLAFLLAPGATAQPAAPTGVTVTPAKKDGALVGGVLTTRMSGPLRFDVFGTTRGAIVTVFADGQVLAQGPAKGALARLATPKGLSAPEGPHTLLASQTVEGVESPRVAVGSIVVDRTPPAPPSAPDLAPESDTGASNSDDYTASTSLRFTGTGEPGATAQLLAAGKPLKGATAVVDAGGAYAIAVAKAKAAALDYAVMQTDAAGNASTPSAPVRVTVATKPPAPPTAMDLVESDKVAFGRALATASLRPTIVGRGIPGAMIRMKVNGSDAGIGVADGGGFWAISVQTPLPYGVSFFTATQIDLVGKESKPTRQLAVTVLLDNGAPAPGADAAVLFDDFNDNSRSGMWKAFEQDHDAVRVNEQNQRLEIAVNRRNGARTSAGYISDGWALDLTHDFKVRVNWRMNALSGRTSEVALAMGLVMDGSTTTGAIYDGVLQVVGADQSGPFSGFESTFDGDAADHAASGRSATLGTLYMWYSAADDRLRMSQLSFTDANARVVFGPRSAAGADSAAIVLTGWEEGLTTGVAGSSAYFDNFVIESGMVINKGLPSEGDGAQPVRSDDFDDNTRGPDWVAFSSNGDFLTFAESNRRLSAEFLLNPRGLDATRGIFSKNWAIDLTHDFRMRIDQRFPVGTTQSGGLGLTVGVVLDGSTTTGQVNEGVVLFSDAGAGGSFNSWTVRRGGALVDSGEEARTKALQTLYLRYEAGTNRLYFTTKGYNDSHARFVAGLRTSTKTRAIIFLGAFTTGTPPALPSGAAWFDNFALDRGATLNGGLSVAPSADGGGSGVTVSIRLRAGASPDLNHDGVVDNRDVATLMISWGRFGRDLPADLDGDGVVGASDLRIVVRLFGPWSGR